jgi:predicted nucleic-acid-binding Zn-ribbon protein
MKMNTTSKLVCLKCKEVGVDSEIKLTRERNGNHLGVNFSEIVKGECKKCKKHSFWYGIQ